MEVERLADGLWRWTTSAPAAAGCPPGRAASVYLETADAVLLFDPAVPAAGSVEAERFWRALDADVSRLARPLVVLLTRPRHARDTAAVLDRYAGVTVRSPGWSTDAAVPFGAHRFDPGETLPGGVGAHVVRSAGGEAAYELPGGAALVVGDVVPPRGATSGSTVERILPAHGPPFATMVSATGS